MMVDLNQTWALLWSQSQNALHIETLADMQATNASAFVGNHSVDYVTLGLGTREQCEAGALRMRPVLAQRELGIEGGWSIAAPLERVGVQA